MPLNQGDEFAGYTIVRLLGSGGMGEVYLAQHPRLPRRDALKILPAHLTADDEFRQRFSREADLAARLSHPNIVDVYDRGEHRGQLWISMNYVEGTDAAELLGSRYRSGMPRAEVLEIVTAVADALDYAHFRGLLHRDVKPANILLGEGVPRRRRIMLADFGIARQFGDVGGLTATNMIVGTTAYCAPEQLQGADVDGRADQYALGCTAYHLLTGSAPYQNSNPAVVITQHLSAPPPLVGERRPELAGLNDVIARAIAKKPDDRYPSCSDFAAALGDQYRTAPTDTSATDVPTTRAAGVAVPPTTVLPHTTPPTAAQPSAPAARRRRIPPAMLIAALATFMLVAVAVVVVEQLVTGQPRHSGNGATSSSAGAAAPSTPAIQLSKYITDRSGVLAPAGRAAAQRAIEKLYADRKVRLWVVYVNDFSGVKPLRWAEDTMRANGFSDRDVLLAVATDSRSFSFRVPAAVTNGTAIDVEAIRRSQIEPAVSRDEWARAAVAAANGLELPAG